MLVRSSLGLLLAVTLPAAAATRAPEARAWPARMPRVEASATSTLGAPFAPWRVVDGWARGLWCEGREDDGLGEALTLRFDVPQQLGYARLESGVLISVEHFQANTVPTVVELTTDDGRRVLAGDQALVRAQQWGGRTNPNGVTLFPLGGAPVRSLTLRVRQAQLGPGHTCLSELQLFPGQPLDTEGAPGALVQVADALDEEARLQPVPLQAAAYEAFPTGVPRVLEALRTCDAGALAALVRYPLTYDWVDPAEAARATREGGAADVNTIVFRNAEELARTCKTSPRETPRAPGLLRGEALFEDLSVESPTQVSVRVDDPDGGEGAQWLFGFSAGHWRLEAVR